MTKQLINKDQIKDTSITISSANVTLTPVEGMTYICTVPLESLILQNVPISLKDIAIYFTTDDSSDFTLTATDLEDKWYYVTTPEFEMGSDYVICISNGRAIYAKIGE